VSALVSVITPYGEGIDQTLRSIARQESTEHLIVVPPGQQPKLDNCRLVPGTSSDPISMCNEGLADAQGGLVMWLLPGLQVSPGFAPAAAQALAAEPELALVATGPFEIGRHLIGGRHPQAFVMRREHCGPLDETLGHLAVWDATLSALTHGPGISTPDHWAKGRSSDTHPESTQALHDIFTRHQGLYATHAEAFWRALFEQRERRFELKSRYATSEGVVRKIKSALRRGAGARS